MRKSSLLNSLILGFTWVGGGPAQAGELSLTTDIAAVSEYVFRGVSLADSAVQPGVELAYGKAVIGGWFSSGFGEDSAGASDEFDLYASYSFDLPNSTALDVGMTYYHYPQTGNLFETKDGAAGSYEPYVSLSLNGPLSPAFSAYYDLTLETLTVEAGVSREFELAPKLSAELGATVGHIDAKGSDYSYGQITAGLSHQVNDSASIYISGDFIKSSENTLGYKDIQAGTPEDNLGVLRVGIQTGF